MSGQTSSLFVSIDGSDAVNPDLLLQQRSKIELQKRWDDCTCDEAVYIAESAHGQCPVGLPITNLYLAGVIWFEVELRFVLYGNTYLDSIFDIDGVDESIRNVGVINRSSSRMDGDEAVLIQIAKLVQLPEGMALRRVRSFVRLKSVKLFRNIGREQAEMLPVSRGILGFRDIREDWEENIPRSVAPCVRESQLPSHLIESRTQAVEKLSKDHSEFGLEGIKCVPLDVASVLGVILASDGVRFFKKNVNMPLESIKVRLCPFRFEYQIGCGA